MIRIEAIWLAVEPVDLRMGLDSALARVVAVFGAAQPHWAYLFANRRGNRIKVLVHDGYGLWLAVRRLHPRSLCLERRRRARRLEPRTVRCLGAGVTVAALGSGSGRERGVGAARAQSANPPIARASIARHTAAMIDAADVDRLSAAQVRALAARLIDTVRTQSARIEEQQQALRHRQATIERLTHELAVLRRVRFGVKSEAWSAGQRGLFEESADEDLAALEERLSQLRPPAADRPRGSPKRLPLPSALPRREIRHEPESTVCTCGCALRRIGEDVAERLDYEPGRFQVERHVRGKWVCGQCRTLVQAPVPPQVIDKGLPTSGLLAQVLVAKYADHLPLYRQEAIYARAGVALSRSTLAQWVGACGVQLQPLVDALRQALLARAVLHADETPVPVLDPGAGKTHRAYLWSYASTAFDGLRAVVFDLARTRAGEHPRTFLGAWRGTLVCDDYAGYKALFGANVTEAGCLAHARRKFHELHAAGKSTLADQALLLFGRLYEVEREVKELHPDQRRRIRQSKAQPIADDLHAWLIAQRQKLPDGSATAKAIDYSLKRWGPLTRYLDDGNLPAGRVGMWRGGCRLGLSVGRPFRLAVPEYPRRGSVSTSPSSNRTCGLPASGSLPTHQAFAFERPRAIGRRRISPNVS